MWQWGDMLHYLAKIAKDRGYIETADLDQLSNEEAVRLNPSALYGYGTNQRIRGIRARKVLG